MNNHCHAVIQDIDAKISELQDLRARLIAFVTSYGMGEAAAAPVPRGTTPAEVQSGKSPRRKVQGAVLEYAQKHSPFSLSDCADAIGVKVNNCWAGAKALVRDGKLVKEGKQYRLSSHPVNRVNPVQENPKKGRPAGRKDTAPRHQSNELEGQPVQPNSVAAILDKHGVVLEALSPFDTASLDIVRLTLPDTFSATDLASRVGSDNRAYRWLAIYKDKGWVENPTHGLWKRTPDFGTKAA